LSTAADLPLIIGWAAAEGWNPGLSDATTFRAADPDGFLLSRLHDEPVAAISLVRYGPAHAFLGLYLVPPALRGRGHGLAIWNAAIARAGTRGIGLDGVVAQQANYRKSGFVFAWNNARMQAVGIAPTPDDPHVVALAAVPFARVGAYDSAIFVAQREAFLRAWIDQPGAAALGYVRDGMLVGVGVLRPCLVGYKIGPLFADDDTAAETLLTALLARAGENQLVFLDIPQSNPAAVALAARHGMTQVFETARMYRGTPPPVPLQRVYGITTFELG